MFVELWEWSGDRVPLDHISERFGVFRNGSFSNVLMEARHPPSDCGLEDLKFPSFYLVWLVPVIGFT